MIISLFFIIYALLFIAIIIFIWYIIKTFFITKSVKLHPGDKAPDFVLQDDTGTLRRLSDFAGKKIALYFYPKSDTPGCTKQACGLRDTFQEFERLAIVVLGISYDTPNELHAFKEKYHLPFILLSDSTREVAKLYGAYKTPINILFPSRMTFLIDENGKIVKVLENINITTHAQDILKSFKQ